MSHHIAPNVGHQPMSPDGYHSAVCAKGTQHGNGSQSVYGMCHFRWDSEINVLSIKPRKEINIINERWR